MRWVPAGDRAAVAVWDGEADETGGPAACAARIAAARLPWVVDIVPAYDTVTVVYDPARAARAADRDGEPGVWPFVESALRRALAAGGAEASARPRVIEIPVRYGGADGPDLEACAERAGMDPDAFVSAHASARYTVAMIGFMPGFPYLSGLPERLAQPRLATPRRRVPAGSVGIAGVQTGVYPFDSPGGWQIIGRTDLRLFDPGAAEPSLLRAGDIVRFVPVAGDGRNGGDKAGGSQGCGGVQGEGKGGWFEAGVPGEGGRPVAGDGRNGGDKAGGSQGCGGVPDKGEGGWSEAGVPGEGGGPDAGARKEGRGWA
jgi:inhibitor of KinA